MNLWQLLFCTLQRIYVNLIEREKQYQTDHWSDLTEEVHELATGKPWSSGIRIDSSLSLSLLCAGLVFSLSSI